MLRKFLFALTLVCTIAGCVPTDDFYEGPDGDYGKSLFADFQTRNVKALRQKFDPKVLATWNPAILDQMATFFPATPPRSVAVVFRSTQIFHLEDGTARRVNVSLQYEFKNRWLLANATWRETVSGDRLVERLNVQPLAKSLKETNSFQLEGKGIGNYVILALSVAVPIFCIAAFIVCVCIPMTRTRKLLWCLGILIGFGRVGVNWTSGEIMVNPLYIQFLSAGYLRWGPFAPHQISVSLPFFAILFFWKRHQGKLAPSEDAENTLMSATSD